MMKVFKIENIFRLIVVLSILKGANAWFFWGQQLYVNVIFAFVSGVYAIYNKHTLKYNKYSIISLLIFTYLAYYISDGSLNGFIGSISVFFPLYILAGSDMSIIKSCLNLIQKTLLIIFIPSVVIHLILLIAKIPPVLHSLHPASEAYVFDNYIFLVKNYYLYERRFCSIFLEPGYLGTLCCFMLFADRYDMKKKANKVILLVLILSFSLAGYITALLGYILLNVKFSKKYIKRLVSCCFAVLAIYLFSINYNGGQNKINELIFERLKIDEEKGISGNNRVFGMTDEYFDLILESDLLWTGLGSTRINQENEYSQDRFGMLAIAGAGYKIFILRYGLLAVIYIFAAYFFLCLSPKDKKYSMKFLFLIAVTFVQAAYPLSTSWLIPLVCGLKLNDEYNLISHTRQIPAVTDSNINNGAEIGYHIKE